MQSATALLLRWKELIPSDLVRSRSTLGQLTGDHRERRQLLLCHIATTWTADARPRTT